MALGLNVLSNDTDVDHPTPIVAVLVDDLTPGTGILTLGNFNATSKEWDGTFVYDADGFSGVTQFTYMAQDPLGANSVKATVTLIGAPAFSIADVTVDEDAGVATLTITLDPVAPAPSSVDYSTTDGSAVAPGDYTGAAATRVDFGTGESTKQIQVPIIDDAIDELVEKFQVVLSNAQGGGDPVAVVSTVADSADVTINDNDDPPVLTVEPAKSLTEGDSGTTDVDITVSLSAVKGLDVTVKYDTVDVTAQDSDNDFTFVLDGMLTIPAGETQTSANGGTEKITVLGDTKYEADETFKVVFHDAVNATLGTTSTVTIVNDDAPTANANSDTTDEDTELTSSGSVLDNDSTPAAGATLTAALDQAIFEGALTLNADGTYTFDPRGAFDDLQVGESRDATFTYMAVDSRGTTPDSAPATVRINVDGVNDAPVAIDDPYQVQQGLPLNVAAPGILGNDTDADGDSLTVAILVDPLPANTGSLTFNGDGSFSYDAEGFSGVTQFTYMAQDPLGANSVKATVALIGAPAFSIADVTVDEGGLATLTITLDPVAPEASSVDYATMDGTAVAPGDYTAKQTTTLNFAPNQSTTEITVQTAQDNIHEINEKFGVVLSNATGGGDPVAVVSTIAGHAYVTITDDETPPMIVPDAKADVNEGDSGTKELEITVKLVGTDTETDVTVAYITNADSAGVGEDYIGTDGTVTFLAGQKTATIKVTINGDTKYELDESFNVNWLEPVSVGSDDTVTLKPKVTVVTIFNDDKPAAGPDRDYTTQEETPLDVAAPGLLAGVADPLNVGFTAAVGLSNPPTKGTVVVNPDGSFTYTPDVDETGLDTFEYHIDDGRFLSDPATVEIDIINANDAPEVAQTIDDVTVDEDSDPTLVSLASVFTDPDGDDVTLTAQSSDPSLVDTTIETTTLRLTYGADKNGTAEITVTATDVPGGLSVSTTFTVKVNPVDDPPAGVPDTATTDEDTPVTIDVLGNDNAQDVDGDTLTVVSVDNTDTTGTASLGSVIYDPNGKFESLDDGESKIDTFQYVLTDGTGQDTTTVTVTVEGRNDAPTATADSYLFFDETLKIDAANGVLANDDVVDTADKGKLVARLVADLPEGEGTLALRGNGSFDYIPVAGVSRTSFTYQVFDGTDVSNTVTVGLRTGLSFVITAPKTVKETAGTVEVQISLINPLAGAVSTVTLGTAPGAAPDGATADDVGAVGGGTTVTLSDTQLSTTRTIQITDDNVREGAEDFFAVLSNPSANSGIKIGRARIFILDPDDRPTVTIEPAQVDEDKGPAKVTITLVGRTKLGAKVQYRTNDTDPVSAKSVAAPLLDNQDYGPVVDEVVFAPNMTADSVSREIEVSVRNDKIDEKFLVLLIGATEQAPVADGGLAGLLAKVEGPLRRTDPQATVTIVDDDDLPSLIVLDKRVNEVDGAVTVEVELKGASSKGVTATARDVPPLPGLDEGRARRFFDYNTLVTHQLTWGEDESGTKSFTINVLDDSLEEDAEIVIIIVESGPENAQIGRGTGFLTIDDDEPSAKVVTITSMDEAVPGDQFFLVVAASESAALGLSGIKAGGVTSNWPGSAGATLMKIEDLPMVLRYMHGLNWVKSKPATHVMLGAVPEDYPQGRFEFTVDLDFTNGGIDTRRADLDVVGARSNRNYFLFPSVNFVGLGLDPADPSIAALLGQHADAIHPDFEDDVVGDDQDKSVRLMDVVEKIIAYEYDADGGFIEYHTDDRRTKTVNEQPAAQSLTELRPYQGMIFKTRKDAFKWVPVGPFGELRPVPIRMNIDGPFLDISNPLKATQIVQEARQGWNLVAPHTEDAAPFYIVFRSLLVPLAMASGSVSFEREVVAVQQSNVVAHIVERFAIATISGMIRPEFSHWLRVEAFGTIMIPKASEPALP